MFIGYSYNYDFSINVLKLLLDNNDILMFFLVLTFVSTDKFRQWGQSGILL